MEHYVCAGDCGGESEKVGICQNEGCPREGMPLVDCSCDDGKHAGIKEVTLTEEEPDVEKMDDEDNF